MFSSNAQWLWCESADRPYHNVVCFRRRFEVDSEPTRGRLRITADARYTLFVNGEWIGHGPGRAWPSAWPVDTYDLRGLLRPGANVVAVLVQDWGVGTFQYIHARPGMIAELEWNDRAGSHELFSDAQWRCRPHPGYLWPVPRIDCEQAWEEQFDANAAPGNEWAAMEVDLAGWTQATASSPDRAFVPREIPMLTHEPVYPVRFCGVEAVRPAPYTWSLNPRDCLNAEDRSCNPLHGHLLLLTHIHSDAAQAVRLHPAYMSPMLTWKLNGQTLAFDDHTRFDTETGVAHAQLNAGWNTLMTRMPEIELHWWTAINIWTERPVRFADAPSDAAAHAWCAVGPFGDPANPPASSVDRFRVLINASSFPEGATLEALESIWQAGMLTEQTRGAAYVRPAPQNTVAIANIYAQCLSEEVVAGVAPQVDEPAAMLVDTQEWTTIHPAAGADVRLLVDFGREIIGFQEFEIDAPAGTMVDVHNFEFIQPDGRRNLGEIMNNTFRYVCREGLQQYRTLLRRGFQYAWITLRNFDRPVRLRMMRTIMNTYPQQRQGDFACSDERLNRIWRVGAHSLHCCSEDTYTDCPAYEQVLWVGDARNEALVDFVVNGDPRLSAHSWKLSAQSLDRSPLVESHVPSGWADVLPAWSFLWMRWALEHYQWTGDATLAGEMLDSLQRNVEGVKAHLSSRGLFKIVGWNMFDWAPMDTPSNGEVTHVNCLAVLGLREAAQLAELLHRDDLARDWRTLAEQMRQAINTHLWDDREQAYIDCIRPDGSRSPVFSQQTHTAAYIADVPDADRMARCRELMTHAPAHFVQAGSPFFMFFVLEGLIREKRSGELLQAIRDYWGPQIDAGATAFWETYHADRPRMTRSHCHGWSAAPTCFLSRDVLGVSPGEPGFATVRIAPLPGDLTWARGRVPTPYGPVHCHWRRGDGQMTLSVQLPADLSVQIELADAVAFECCQGEATQRPTTDNATMLDARGRIIELCIKLR